MRGLFFAPWSAAAFKRIERAWQPDLIRRKLSVAPVERPQGHVHAAGDEVGIGALLEGKYGARVTQISRADAAVDAGGLRGAVESGLNVAGAYESSARIAEQEIVGWSARSVD